MHKLSRDKFKIPIITLNYSPAVVYTWIIRPVEEDNRVKYRETERERERVEKQTKSTKAAENIKSGGGTTNEIDNPFPAVEK